MKTKVPFNSKFSVFLGAGSIQFNYYFVLMFSMFFFTNVMKLAPAAVGTMILIAKIWDAVNDPMCGALIDRTHSKMGKARPWFFGGSIALAIFCVLMFFIPNWSYGGKLVWSYITYNGVAMAFTAASLGIMTMLPRMSANPLDRVTLSSSYVLGCSIFGIILSTAAMPIVNYYSKSSANPYFPVSIIVSVVGLALAMLCVKLSKEPSDDAQDAAHHKPLKESLKAVAKNTPFIVLTTANVLLNIAGGFFSGSLLFYLTYNLKNVQLSSIVMPISYITMFAATVSARYVVGKFDKLKLVKFCLLIAAACYTVRFLTRDASIPVMIIMLILAGLALGYCGVLIMPMLMDCIEYGEYKNKSRDEGLILSSYTFSAKIGQGIGTALLGYILQAAGYNAVATEQSTSALNAIFHSSVTSMIAGYGLMLIILLGYKLSDKKMAEIAAQKASETQSIQPDLN